MKTLETLRDELAKADEYRGSIITELTNKLTAAEAKVRELEANGDTTLEVEPEDQQDYKRGWPK